MCVCVCVCGGGGGGHDRCPGFLQLADLFESPALFCVFGGGGGVGGGGGWGGGGAGGDMKAARDYCN